MFMRESRLKKIVEEASRDNLNELIYRLMYQIDSKLDLLTNKVEEIENILNFDSKPAKPKIKAKKSAKLLKEEKEVSS